MTPTLVQALRNVEQARASSVPASRLRIENAAALMITCRLSKASSLLHEPQVLAESVVP